MNLSVCEDSSINKKRLCTIFIENFFGTAQMNFLVTNKIGKKNVGKHKL